MRHESISCIITHIIILGGQENLTIAKDDCQSDNSSFITIQFGQLRRSENIDLSMLYFIKGIDYIKSTEVNYRIRIPVVEHFTQFIEIESH